MVHFLVVQYVEMKLFMCHSLIHWKCYWLFLLCFEIRSTLIKSLLLLHRHLLITGNLQLNTCMTSFMIDINTWFSNKSSNYSIECHTKALSFVFCHCGCILTVSFVFRHVLGVLESSLWCLVLFSRPPFFLVLFVCQRCVCTIIFWWEICTNHQLQSDLF